MILTAGVPVGTVGTTNMIRVHVVGRVLMRGTGIGVKAVTGRVCIVRHLEEFSQSFQPGDVLVMESLDNHPVLASAAYNAGPGRARRWRADRPLEGAIYAETIPFNETRDYVKKVMSNSVYYSALFEGKPQTLKPRLGVIGPRSDAPKGEDLP